LLHSVNGYPGEMVQNPLSVGIPESDKRYRYHQFVAERRDTVPVGHFETFFATMGEAWTYQTSIFERHEAGQDKVVGECVWVLTGT